MPELLNISSSGENALMPGRVHCDPDACIWHYGLVHPFRTLRSRAWYRACLAHSMYPSPCAACHPPCEQLCLNTWGAHSRELRRYETVLAVVRAYAPVVPWGPSLHVPPVYC